MSAPSLAPPAVVADSATSPRPSRVHGPDRMTVPAPLAWMRDEALLRPPAIARVAGLTDAALARWAAGAWVPGPAEVPMLAPLAALHARLVARAPAAPARRRWWGEARRELGWLAPAELLRRGRVGEVLLLAE